MKKYTFQHDSGTTVTVTAPDNQSALAQLERDDMFQLIHQNDGWLINLRSWHLIELKRHRPLITGTAAIAAICALFYFGNPKPPNFYVEPNKQQHIWRVYNNGELLEAFPSLKEAKEFRDQCEEDYESAIDTE